MKTFCISKGFGADLSENCFHVDGRPVVGYVHSNALPWT